ncbi:Bax inhibitor-1 family protein [Sphingomonas sp. BAUL-RG-20F-R05-02]|uniref:Bax inhibitor-1/YccA family protein n=1 Tax=Sphingomonas sp. BAUL-RG-20F-R05-02 TaxID=2914830 RepID=UPI001F56F96B|nr:Bax inhibitor-1/YccA family protein [Sphingomonas sp. BAUL-RG-20F-R05-02]
MANWSDPRSSASPFGADSAARAGAFDAGLRRYMLSVYNYMMSAVLLSGIVALAFVASGVAAQVFLGGGILKWIISFAPLGFIFAMSFGGGRMTAGTMQLMFWGFAVAMGLSLSTIFLVYSPIAIAQSFFAAAAAFGGLSLYGYTTKRNLSAMGTFLMMGLVGLIVASLLNLFFHSGPLAMVISFVGVLIFAGLTAYDTQRTKSMYAQVAGTGAEQHMIIMSALNLYLDFINMFLFILRLFGNRN